LKQATIARNSASTDHQRLQKYIGMIDLFW